VTIRAGVLLTLGWREGDPPVETDSHTAHSWRKHNGIYAPLGADWLLLSSKSPRPPYSERWRGTSGPS
jgi:hypothetical protein